MEEDKAAAYYDELTRRGDGAARFKQGLGFSSSSGDARGSGSAFVSSSFLSSFVRASSPTTAQKQAQLESIQNKLRHRHRDRDRDRRSRKRSRSSERHRNRDRHHRRRSRSRSRSCSPRERRWSGREKSIDYSRLIDGYDRMTPAERVKAKMKFQLAETAEKDEASGMSSGWERFDFDKDAPLDDEEIQAAEDDGSLVKHIGQSFRFSAVEARREEQLKAAHDEAMFGSSTQAQALTEDAEPQVQNNSKASNESSPATDLLSDKVLAQHQGSWRDRARKA